MILRRTSFVHQEKVVKEAIGSATIVESMIIYHMSVPRPTSVSQAQARRTMMMVRRMASITRRAHLRRRLLTSPTTRRRVNIVVSWSISGSLMEKLQLIQVVVKMRKTRRLRALLSRMMKNLRFRHHPCGSWQSISK
jgi:hypothetical protein